MKVVESERDPVFVGPIGEGGLDFREQLAGHVGLQIGHGRRGQSRYVWLSPSSARKVAIALLIEADSVEAEAEAFKRRGEAAARRKSN